MHNLTEQSLSPGRQALPRSGYREGGAEAFSEQAISCRAAPEPVPLSFAQQRLWFLDQLEPGNPAYNIHRAIRMRGVLNVEALNQTLDEIVRRHESLRTGFAAVELYAAVDGKPLQVIAENRSLPLPILDLTHLPETEQEPDALRLAAEEASRPFDLTRSPLIRASLLRLAQDDHIFLLTMHHIIGDAWSMEILFQELALLYEAFTKGKPSPLQQLQIQYADYALWQRDRLQGSVLESQLSYWKERLAAARALLELPTDRPRPPVQSFRGAKQRLVVAKEISEGLKKLSQREGVTLYMSLLAAYAVLLWRYSGQEEILVGTPLANRHRVETEGVIGLFLNTVVMRGELGGDPEFVEVMRRVREAALGAYENQELPFEKLVEELHPEPSLSYTPVFQVLFHLTSAPKKALKLPGLNIDDFELDSAIAKFDLTLEVTEEAEGLSCLLTYSTDLFDAATISRMLGHFQTLLEAVVANPRQRVSRVPMLTKRERHQLLVEWNDTRTQYPQDRCIHQLFEAQVERAPHAVAVVFEQEEVTYRELNRRANQLANYLRAMGVGPEALVGICMERSVDMVVGLLGILKAGGAYVPLDPAYPKERLSFMLKDARAPVLLTQERLLNIVPEHGAEVVRLDAEWKKIGQESEENPASGVALENLAYVIYTSGSTGKPKGAMNTHSGLCNRLLWMQEAYRLTETDRVLQKTPFSFDVSVWEFFWPLITGARLVVARPGGHQDSAQLIKLINEQHITTLHFVPSMLRVFLEAQGLESCSCVRQVICSGEALPLELQQRFFARLGAELHNLYGPTEASIDVTFWACKRGDDQRLVPIGRPIANTQVYLLDEHLRPVPIGVSGELHIGGDGLARGYLNRPEMTAEKFIPSPFSAEAGARLYKTGDLARYLPSGEIEYLGRIDHQVKVRGFRIELGEIEAVLAEHAGVRESVVIAREDVPSDKRLVAYVAPDLSYALSNSTSITRELRRFLKDRLPEYMVPSAIVVLEALPLMPNGKLDRRALPAPDESRPDLEGTFIAPRDTLELQLAKIWENVLAIQPIGVRDNFFELGGHSLLAMRLFAQIENRFGNNLPLATLFQAPTVEQLADILRQGGVSAVWSSLVAIQPGGSKPPLFCVHAAGSNVLIYRPLARHLGPDQPVYALQAQGLDGQNSPYMRVQDMAAHYIKEMRGRQPEGPYFLVGASFGGLVVFEMAQQLRKQGQKVALLAMFNTSCPVYTLQKRIRCHIGHFVQYGPKTYATRLAKALKMRISKLGEKVYTAADARSVVDGHLDGDDPLTRTIVANLQAEKDYVPESKTYPGKIILFWASDAKSDCEDNRLGWRRLAAGGLEVHVVPGNHTTMREEPHVAVLTEQLMPCLHEAQATEPLQTSISSF